MKSKKTNILLGIIAINLTLLTVIQLGIWPTKVNANELELNSGINYGFIPLNADGSIDVNINSSKAIMDVNLEQLRGKNCLMHPIDSKGNLLAVKITPNGRMLDVK